MMITRVRKPVFAYAAIFAIALTLAVLSTNTGDVRAQSAVPERPTGLAAASATHNGVTLTWDAPGDGSITGYQVLRRSVDGPEYGDGLGPAEFAAVAEDTGSSDTTYTDTSVSPRTRYNYQLKARNALGLSEPSGLAEAETPDAPASPPVQAEQTCPAPTPVEVPVAAVPVVAESTTADYFVLYASHDLDGTTVEFPVRVVLGEDGATTISEGVQKGCNWFGNP